jgi:hypothetical protein
LYFSFPEDKQMPETSYAEQDKISYEELERELLKLRQKRQHSEVARARTDSFKRSIEKELDDEGKPSRQSPLFRQLYNPAVQTGANIVGPLSRAAGFVADKVGADEIAADLRAFADDANRYSNASSQVAADTFDETAMPDWIERAGQSALSTLPTMMATGGAAGAPGAIGTAVTQVFDDAITEAKDAGLDPDAQLFYAAQQAAIEGGITSVFQKFAPGLEGMFGKAGTAEIRKGFMTGAKEFVKTTGQELPEELAIELLGNVIRANSGVDPNADSSANQWQTLKDTTAATIATLGLASGLNAPMQMKLRREEDRLNGQADALLEGLPQPQATSKQAATTPLAETSQEDAVAAAKPVEEAGDRTANLSAQNRQTLIHAAYEQARDGREIEDVIEAMGYHPELLEDDINDFLDKIDDSELDPARPPILPPGVAPSNDSTATREPLPQGEAEQQSPDASVVPSSDVAPPPTRQQVMPADQADVQANAQVATDPAVENTDQTSAPTSAQSETLPLPPSRQQVMPAAEAEALAATNEAPFEPASPFAATTRESEIETEQESTTPFTEGLKRIAELADMYEMQAQQDEGGEGVAVGAGNIAERWRADGLRSMSRRIQQGATVEEAANATKAEMKNWVNTHNARRPNDTNWQRWEGAGSDAITEAQRILSPQARKQIGQRRTGATVPNTVGPVPIATPVQSPERNVESSVNLAPMLSAIDPTNTMSVERRSAIATGLTAHENGPTGGRRSRVEDTFNTLPDDQRLQFSDAIEFRQSVSSAAIRLAGQDQQSVVAKPTASQKLKARARAEGYLTEADETRLSAITKAVKQLDQIADDAKDTTQVAEAINYSGKGGSYLRRTLESANDEQVSYAPQRAAQVLAQVAENEGKPNAAKLLWSFAVLYEGRPESNPDVHAEIKARLPGVIALASDLVGFGATITTPATKVQQTGLPRSKKQLGQRRTKSAPNEDRATMPQNTTANNRQNAKASEESQSSHGRTPQGRKLLRHLQRDIERGNRSVGSRSITSFLLDEFAATIFVTKSQTSRKHPALFRHNGAVVFSRSASWQINIHEAGHAMDLMLRDRFPGWFEKMEAKLQKFVEGSQEYKDSHAAEFASSDTANEAIAEVVRLYVVGQESRVPKPLMRGFKRLVNAASPDAMNALDDAKEAYALHASRSPQDRRIADRNDKPKPQDAQRSVADTGWAMLTHVVGKSPILHRLRRHVYQQVAGESDVAQFDPTGVVGSVAGWADEGHRRRQKIADEVLASLDEGTSNIDTAYQNQLRRQAVKIRAIGGTVQNEGVRLYLHGNGFNALALGREANQAVLVRLSEAGFIIPEKLARHGEGQQFHNKSYSQIKAMIPEDQWQGFQQAFMDRAAIERHRKSGQSMPGLHEGNTIDEIEADNALAFAENPAWEKVATEIQTFMDQLLLISVVAGNMTPDDAITIKNKWEHYAPLQRQMDDIQGTGGRSGTEPRFGVHKARGSMREYRDLDLSVYARVSQAIDAYHDNALIKSVVDYTEKVSRDKRIDYGTRKEIERMMIPLNMDSVPAAQVNQSEQHEIIADAINRMRLEAMGQSAEKLDAKQVHERLKALGGDALDADSINVAMPGKPLFRHKAPNIQNVVTMWEGGQRRFYLVNDPVMFSLFTSTSGATGAVRFFSKMATGMTEPWKRAYTNSFKFLVRNLVRDPPTAAFLSRDYVGMIPGFYTASAMVGRLTGGEYSMEARDGAEMMTKSLDATTRDKHKTRVQHAKDVMLEGLVVPGFGSLSVADKVASVPGIAMSTLLKPVDFFNYVTGTRWLAEQTESLAREGAYIRARQRGKSQADAHAMYDKISGNFGQRQADKAVADVIRAAGFLNPALQVIYQMGEAITEANPDKRLKMNAARAGYLSTLGAVAAATNYLIVLAMYGDDEDELEAVLRNMRERDENERLSNMAVLGVVRLPFDYGPAGSVMSFSYNAVEDQLLGNRVDSTERAKALLKRAVQLPGFDEVIPPHAKVGYELWNNHSFYQDREIVPEYLMRTYAGNDALQFAWYTPDLYRDIGAQLNVSPMKIQYAVRGLTTAIVDDTVQFMDKANKRGWKVKDLPPIAGLTTWEATGSRSRSVDALMELGDVYDATTQALAKDSRLSESQRAELIERRKGLQIAKAVNSRIESLNAEVSEEQRREQPDYDRIESLNAEMTKIASEFYNSGVISGDLLESHFEQMGGKLIPYKKGRVWKTGQGQPEPPSRPAMSREANPSLWASYDRSIDAYKRRVDAYASDQEQAREFTASYLDWLRKNRGSSSVQTVIDRIRRDPDFRAILSGRDRPRYDRKTYRTPRQYHDAVQQWSEARAAAIEFNRMLGE